MSASASLLAKIKGVEADLQTNARCCTPLRPNAGMVQRIDEIAAAGRMEQSPDSGRLPPIETKGTPQSTPGKLSARTLGPTIPSSEDAYSARERQLAEEVNIIRRDPVAFAAHLSEKVILYSPFTPGPGMRLVELKQHKERCANALQEATSALQLLEEGEQKEIQALRDQWAIEDAERNKKAKKAGGQAKRRGSRPDAAAQPDEIDTEREEAVKQIVDANSVRRQELQQAIDEQQDLVNRATSGIQTVDTCCAKLRSTKPISQLTFCRGLSLTARDMCGEAIPVDEACARYGSATGTVASVTHRGMGGVSQVLMECLLGLQDGKKKSRLVLLDPNATLIGVGWRRSDKLASSMFVVSSSFEELEAISTRPHVNLSEVKRLLPLASQISDKREIRTKDGSGVQFLEPRAHPVVCSNTFTATVECAPSVLVTASLYSICDPEPVSPSFFSGEVFVQRLEDPNVCQINATLPHGGKFGLVIFYRNDSSTSASGYQRLTTVQLNAEKWSMQSRAPPFPIASNDFLDRKCSLVGPLSGVLAPDTEYNFTIIVPKTNYLEFEMARVKANLARAARQVDGSQAASESLQESFAEADQLLKDAKLERQQRAPGFQQELANLQKEMSKKRGKELEKLKPAAQELEDQLRQLDVAVKTAQQRASDAEDKLSKHRRAARQASAERRKYTQEQTQLEVATDRSAPLVVEVSLEERRAALKPNSDGTVYSRSVRTPRSGRVSLLISGLNALMWNVSTQ